MRETLEKEKKDLTNVVEYQTRKQDIEKLRGIVLQSKSIEVCLEAISQIFILCGLATFYSYIFKAPSGQTYSYFYGVALLVLKGNANLLIASVFISFLGPCWFFVDNENHKRMESFNLTRMIILFFRNMFLMLARLGSIVSAIFIPVISQWVVVNEGVDAADRLDYHPFEIEFNLYFSKGLQAVSDDIIKNSVCFVGFILVHIFLVAVHGALYSLKFSASSMRER